MYSGGGWGGKGECKNDVKDRVEVSTAMVGVNSSDVLVLSKHVFTNIGHCLEHYLEPKV